MKSYVDLDYPHPVSHSSPAARQFPAKRESARDVTLYLTEALCSSALWHGQVTLLAPSRPAPQAACEAEHCLAFSADADPYLRDSTYQALETKFGRLEAVSVHFGAAEKACLRIEVVMVPQHAEYVQLLVGLHELPVPQQAGAHDSLLLCRVFQHGHACASLAAKSRLC